MSDSNDLPPTPPPTPVPEQPASSGQTTPSAESSEQSAASPEPVAVKPPFPTLLAIDFGSTKLVTTFVRHNSTDLPGIVRNETADLYTKNIISFKGEERLLGEAGVGHSNIHPQHAVESVNRFLGKTKAELDEETLKNTPNLKEGQNGEITFEVPYHSARKQFKPEQITAILLKRIQKFADTLSKANDEPLIRDIVFVVPCSFNQRQLQALKDAAHIAQFNVHGFCRGPAAVATIYGLKHPIVGDEEKHVAFVDMGATEFTFSLSKFGANRAEVIEVLHTTNGGQDFDRSLFHFVQDHVAKKHPDIDISGQRQTRRIYAAVNKAKAVLSTISQTEIVFPLADQDIRIPISREQFKDIAKVEIAAIGGVIAQFKQKITDLGIQLSALEVFGGGARMNIIKELLSQTFGISLSHTLDSDLDLAVGAAALGASNTVGFELKFSCKDAIPDFGQNVPHFLSEAELQQLTEDEAKMQEKDGELVLKARARNNLETFCFEMINTLADDNHKACFPEISKKREFEDKLNEALVWLETNSDLSKEELESKQKSLDEAGRTIVPELFTRLDTLAKEKAANEAKAAADALLHAKESQNADKKPKTNQQKLDVAKDRKELGNKHFVDLDYPSAVKRYTQALELVISMYDETPEQKKEVDAIKLACYLNIAQCLTKVKAFDKAIENCKLALAIDPDNTKALFRRGNAYFFNKEFELARQDLSKAAKLAPEDKTIKQLLAKSEAQIAAQKEKEKQMCARMFG